MSSPLFSKGNVSVLSKCIQEEYDRNKLYISSIYNRYTRNDIINRIKCYMERPLSTLVLRSRYVYFDMLYHLHSS